MDKYAHSGLDLIMKDPNNKVCFDCNAALPKWASVNNAVFLCLNCAGVHRGFGVTISFIRSITMDNWYIYLIYYFRDDKQIAFLKQGGNKRLKNILEEFHVPLNTDSDLKFKLVCVDYYRKILRSEVLGEASPIKPDAVSGLDKLEETARYEEGKYIKI